MQPEQERQVRVCLMAFAQLEYLYSTFLSSFGRIHSSKWVYAKAAVAHGKSLLSAPLCK